MAGRGRKGGDCESMLEGQEGESDGERWWKGPHHRVGGRSTGAKGGAAPNERGKKRRKDPPAVNKSFTPASGTYDFVAGACC